PALRGGAIALAAADVLEPRNGRGQQQWSQHGGDSAKDMRSSQRLRIAVQFVASSALPTAKNRVAERESCEGLVERLRQGSQGDLDRDQAGEGGARAKIVGPSWAPASTVTRLRLYCQSRQHRQS